MKRRENGLIDMTPLLDVVFILLFALIINVNVTRAEDQALMEEQEALIAEDQARIKAYEAAADQASASEEDLASALEDSESALAQAMERVAEAEAALDVTEAARDRQQALLDAYEEAMTQALDREIDGVEDPELKAWLEDIRGGDLVLEEWMEFQQIAERYLFVDMQIRASDGRVYVNGDYTGIILSHELATDSNLRSEVIRELQLYLVDWLDHKDGGYSFVFVTVVEEGSVTRAVAQAAFDCLQGLQITFDKDYYMVNRFVRSSEP